MTSWEILKVLTTDILSWMVLGIVLAWLKLLPKERIQFLHRKVVINVLFPCLILEKILKNLELSDGYNMALLFGGALVMFFGSFALSYLWVPKVARDRPMENSMLLCNTFQNYGFMVFPLALHFFGEKGLALSLIFTLTYDALLWSAGIYMLIRKPGAAVNWREIMNPPAVTVCIAVILALTGFPKIIPAQVYTVLHLPAMFTIPLALIGSGGIFFHSLTGIKWQDIPVREIASSLVSRMLFLPLFWMGIIAFMVPDSMARSILHIEAVMPAAVVPVVLVAIYGGNQRYAVLFILLTHIISIITVPLYLSLIF
jgi:predicted permease